MVEHLVTHLRRIAEPISSGDADRLRRTQNIGMISSCLVGLGLALLAYTALFERVLSNQMVLVATMVGCVVIHALTTRELVDMAGRLLVAIILGAVLLATLSRGYFGLLPFYFTLGLMVAGAVLRPAEVLAAIVGTIGAILALWYGLGDLPLSSFAPGALLVAVLSVNGTAGILALLSAISVTRALHAAERGADQASQAERALRESERYYRLIADHSSDLIALIDAQGRFLYASPSYAQALGHAPVTLVGSLCLALLHPDDRARADADAERARRSGAAQGSYRALTRAGGQRWLDMRMSVAYEEGEAYLIAVARDISERRDLEARLQEAQKMEALGQLAGGVAHDFNNLLFVISGGAELARTALPDEHPARAELDQVVDASQRATGLTRQLLAFARRQVIAPRLISLGALLREARSLIERLAGPEICLATSIPPDLWPVLADPSQIEQVILNLTVNARDAMPAGGELRISLENCRLAGAAERPGDYVRLEVRDTGEGMSAAVQQRIFEPFFSTKGPERGTGLGLATCYGIVTQSGGTITVRSAPGQGSTFTVLLPAAGE